MKLLTKITILDKNTGIAIREYIHGNRNKARVRMQKLDAEGALYQVERITKRQYIEYCLVYRVFRKCDTRVIEFSRRGHYLTARTMLFNTYVQDRETYPAFVTIVDVELDVKKHIREVRKTTVCEAHEGEKCGDLARGIIKDAIGMDWFYGDADFVERIKTAL